MKIRMFLAAGLAAGMALSAFALSAEYLDWARGPAQFLMTKEETAKWKTISTDEDAKAFVALFWARRDPTPDTPRNEFREEFEARAAAADANFGQGKTRGALTDRGRTLILFGKPKKIERAGTQRTPTGMGEEATADASEAEAEAQVWTYDGEDAKTMFAQSRAQIRFVDRYGKSEYTIERGNVDYTKAQQRAVQRAITQPNLTAAPVLTAQAGAAPAGAVTAAASAAPVQTELTTKALQTAVDEFKAAAKSPYNKQSYAMWGEYVTAGGEYFVPVQLYIPKSAGLTATQNLTFFGVVQDESGKNVSAFEAPATLTASKDDYFVDRSLLSLPAGKARGYFGLAENGKPLTIAATDMQLAGTIDKAAPGSSQLVLANNVYALSAAQRADDPYSFGGLKVVPKGDRTFRPADDLWYFVELRNPGIPEVGPDTPVAVNGSETPALAPRVQIKIDVEGTDSTGKKIKMVAPPREVEAVPVKGVPGHYGIGNSIPLATFKPGDYTFTVKVIDTVRKSSYTLSDKFTVVPQ